MDFPYHNPSLQKLSTGVMFLDMKYNPKLHTNQLILIIQVCLQRYLRFVSTIKYFSGYLYFLQIVPILMLSQNLLHICKMQS